MYAQNLEIGTWEREDETWRLENGTQRPENGTKMPENGVSEAGTLVERLGTGSGGGAQTEARWDRGPNILID